VGLLSARDLSSTTSWTLPRPGCKAGAGAIGHVVGHEIRPERRPPRKAPLNCPFPVVGTGVDPVTSCFSAGPGTTSVWSVRLVVPAKSLFTVCPSQKSDLRYYPLFYLVRVDVGTLWARNDIPHTGIGALSIRLSHNATSRRAMSRLEMTRLSVVVQAVATPRSALRRQCSRPDNVP
jgi:hypothetical protein